MILTGGLPDSKYWRSLRQSPSSVNVPLARRSDPTCVVGDARVRRLTGPRERCNFRSDRGVACRLPQSADADLCSFRHAALTHPPLHSRPGCHRISPARRRCRAPARSRNRCRWQQDTSAMVRTRGRCCPRLPNSNSGACGPTTTRPDGVVAMPRLDMGACESS